MRANKYRIRFLGDGFSLLADPPGGVTRVVYGTRGEECHTETVDNNKNSCIACDKMLLFINKFLRITRTYCLRAFFCLICRTVYRSTDSRSEEKRNARLLLVCVSDLADRLSMNPIHIGNASAADKQRVVTPEEIYLKHAAETRNTGASWRQFRIDFDRRGNAD